MKNEEKIKIEKTILEIAHKTAPLINFSIQETDDQDEDTIVVRGSFVHPSGKELVALYDIRSASRIHNLADIVADMAMGYENDRQRKIKLKDPL